MFKTVRNFFLPTLAVGLFVFSIYHLLFAAEKLPKEDPLLVTEREDPRQLRGPIPARPTVCPRDPAWREPRATDRRSPRAISGQ